MFFAGELDPTDRSERVHRRQRKADFGVEPICQTLGVSASAYYQRATGERSGAAAWRTSGCWCAIRRVHEANYECYGSRRVWKALLSRGRSRWLAARSSG